MNEASSTSAPSKTARAPVKLPAIPGEREAAARLPAFEMDRSQVVDGRLVFNGGTVGFDRALRCGFFLVKTPSDMDLEAGDWFAQNFWRERKGYGDSLDLYRGFRGVKVNGDYQGHFDRPHDQWENFYIEMDNWQGNVPPRVAHLGHQMTDLGIIILRDVLAHVGIPERDWAKVTSGLSEKRGHQMLAFNHFRSNRRMRGCKFHRDSGWTTLLRSTEPGLLALVEGKLSRIDPVPGYLIANFGSSIEVLTEHLPEPVRANVHGVARTERGEGEAERVSYVVFLDSNLGGSIYRYIDGEARAVQSMTDFAVQEVSRTYDSDDEHL
jgi:hypothetical protein